MSRADFKALVRDQYQMLRIDEEAALGAIPALLPDALDERREALATIRGIIEASGAPVTLRRPGSSASPPCSASARCW